MAHLHKVVSLVFRKVTDTNGSGMGCFTVLCLELVTNGQPTMRKAVEISLGPMDGGTEPGHPLRLLARQQGTRETHA
jgi:hypothetical protein